MNIMFYFSSEVEVWAQKEISGGPKIFWHPHFYFAFYAPKSQKN